MSRTFKDKNKNHRRYVRNSFIQKMDEEWGSDISHKYKQRCYNKKVRNKIKEMSQQEIKKYS